MCVHETFSQKQRVIASLRDIALCDFVICDSFLLPSLSLADEVAGHSQKCQTGAPPALSSVLCDQNSFFYVAPSILVGLSFYATKRLYHVGLYQQ